MTNTCIGMRGCPRACRPEIASPLSAVMIGALCLIAGCTNVTIRSRAAAVDAAFSRYYVAVINQRSAAPKHWYTTSQVDDGFLPAVEAALSRRMSARGVLSRSQLIDVPPVDPLSLAGTDIAADVRRQIESGITDAGADALLVIQQTNTAVRTGGGIGDNGRESTLDLQLLKTDVRTLVWRASVHVARSGDLDLAATGDAVAEKIIAQLSQDGVLRGTHETTAASEPTRSATTR